MSRLPDTDFDSLLPPLALTRRGFIVTSLASGFALVAGPVAAQTAIQTDTKGLVAGEVKIPVADGSVPAYRAAPEGKAVVPVILVVHEAFGVHEYIKDVCRRLAKAGYMAIAPELYSRQGDPSRYTEISRLLSEVVNKVPDAQVLGDLDATVAWAAKNGGNTERLGITGFCWGGRLVWLYDAHNPKVKAAVVWYGQLVGDADPLHPTQPIEIAAKLNGPVLGLYGGKDAGITQDSIDAMKQALAKGDDDAKASTFVVYPEAGHAFHADYRPSYNADAAKDGWARAVKWFDTYLKS
ncbi:dienelactone hydrolase family protein [Candidimonas sp. SYP-B2681]|uniref:dienelactone hydrolase family protein n=1 Tax=Candidimonas sp. SYP-B2681 TaxID=2497686 RepID=UPI000F88CC61|nr:dienelactone hydrolase family protein [Candidimonas sp. SYP-B2681]RTZ45405.1 dienelactone hydrolase family protein [Candidimonas sp. SYP-B2681]